jgi:Protein of unknown function (DUF3575)
MRKILITTLFISLIINAFGQQSLRDSSSSVVPVLGSASARWVVKIAPLSFFDPENTVQFAAERMLGGRSSVQAEVGYGWPGFQYARNENYSQQEVWRGRAEWRIYNRANRRPLGSYFAIEAFYKQVNILENGTFGRECQSFTCQYFQSYRSLAQKLVAGGHIKYGTQFSLGGNWLLDFYVGLGLRSRNFQRFRPELPNSILYYQSQGWFNVFGRSQTNVFPSATLSFKIGYTIR